MSTRSRFTSPILGVVGFLLAALALRLVSGDASTATPPVSDLSLGLLWGLAIGCLLLALVLRHARAQAADPAHR